MPKIYLCLLFLGFLYSGVVAQNTKPRVQPVPAWVTVNAVDYGNTKLDHEAEDGNVNLVHEQQVSLSQQTTYIRRVIKILSEAGVQNNSEVSISFDPSYSQLIFHTIKIIRGSEVSNQLNLSKIKVLHQESELNRFLYNGSLSAVLILEDVRKGDVIEYSYSIKGFNPVFNGKYTDDLETSFSVPVYNVFYRIVAPANRVLQVKNNLATVACDKKTVGNETSYEWKLTDVPALRVQDQTPSWYDPYAMVMISEYSSWKEVNDWAMQLFPFGMKLSPALQKKIGEIEATTSTPQDRVLAALRFVQDDVRYMGIEMGERSHKPHNPDKVFAQRFGDCKDKSYLLCTILRAMNIDADPVLINTSFKKTILSWLPTHFAFDHVTVRVNLNGKHYWFDPTISYQRGNIDNISYPDYQCGLVIRDTTTALTSIPCQNKGMVDVHEDFKIPDMSGDAQLMVKTVYSGSHADGIREQFNRSSIFEIKKKYQDYYISYYENITADSLNYTDEDSTGKFITKEYYSIKNLWETEKGIRKSYFSPYVISGVLKKPKDINRTMPFYIDYPAKYREEITISVPDDWKGNESLNDVKCSSFTYRQQCAYFYRKFKLKYEYESLKDHVTPEEAKEFFSSYNKADDKIQYILSLKDDNTVVEEMVSNNGKKTNDVWYVLFFIALGFGLIIWWTQRNRR
jgi:Domain of Unknown Function with PDB structure (DUF3857)/Transglutaminase-like superfamily